MPLADKVGQLFVVQANGVFMSEDSEPFQTLRHHVVDNRIGGVMLSRSSVYGAAVLVQKLQEMARTPLLVSADLEAGSGMRFEDTTYGPWAMAIAATGDPSLAERRGRATAEKARAIGVAQVYAPVADVNVNPDNPVINVRSFGEDPSDVARYVVATVHGLQAGQVLATLKHFPGHGDAATDSHRSLVTIPGDRARLESVELVPFRAGIKAGAESVMIAHVSVPSWDATPAPILAPRPERFLAGVIRMEAACDPSDILANRLDPWHGAHYHPHSFARLRVLEDRDDALLVRVAYRVAGPLAVEVDATFHCPDPRTIVMTIVGGEGVGSVVETHATPLGPGRTAVIEATLASSERPGFRLARAVAPLLRPMIERRAARLWVEDIAYAERRYRLRARGPVRLRTIRGEGDGG